MAESLSDRGPAYREAVIDLLAVIAYGEVSAFERLAEDVKLAPTVSDKVDLAAMAGREVAKVPALLDRISALGADPSEAMAPFRAAVDEFHVHTAPADWYEGLVKAYVGDALADDFYREIAAFLDEDTRALINASTNDGDHADFVVERVRAAIAADHALGGRLALWARRLMGEALTQAQHVAAERDALSEFLAGGIDGGLDLTAVAAMFHKLTEMHKARMERLGLEP